MFWLCAWYKNSFQVSRHIFEHDTGTCLCLVDPTELLAVLSPFLWVEWWVLHHGGWAILDHQDVMVGMVWVKGTWKIMYVLWPASKDCVWKGVQEWVLNVISLKCNITDVVYKYALLTPCLYTSIHLVWMNLQGVMIYWLIYTIVSLGA